MKIATVAVALAVAGIASAQVTLDDFTTGPADVSSDSGTTYWGQTGSMIGSERAESIDILSNPYDDLVYINIAHGFASTDGGVDMSSDDALLYGYTPSADHTSDSTFDLALDLSRADSFQLSVAYSENAMTAVMELNNSSANEHTFTVSASTTANTYTIPFSDFAGVNFSDIHQVAITFDVTNSNDFVITNFVAAPEPVGITLLGFGIAGLISRRRRR